MGRRGGRTRAKRYRKVQIQAWGRLCGRPRKLSGIDIDKLHQQLRRGDSKAVVAKKFGISARTLDRYLTLSPSVSHADCVGDHAPAQFNLICPSHSRSQEVNISDRCFSSSPDRTESIVVCLRTTGLAFLNAQPGLAGVVGGSSPFPAGYRVQLISRLGPTVGWKLIAVKRLVQGSLAETVSAAPCTEHPIGSSWL